MRARSSCTTTRGDGHGQREKCTPSSGHQPPLVVPVEGTQEAAQHRTDRKKGVHHMLADVQEEAKTNRGTGLTEIKASKRLASVSSTGRNTLRAIVFSAGEPKGAATLARVNRELPTETPTPLASSSSSARHNMVPHVETSCRLKAEGAT